MVMIASRTNFAFKQQRRRPKKEINIRSHTHVRDLRFAVQCNRRTDRRDRKSDLLIEKSQTPTPQQSVLTGQTNSKSKVRFNRHAITVTTSTTSSPGGQTYERWRHFLQSIKCPQPYVRTKPTSMEETVQCLLNRNFLAATTCSWRIRSASVRFM